MTDDQYLTYGKITPDNSGGGIIFHFNAEDFDGKTVVVYERLYIEKDDGTKHLVADHQDITDEDQSIHFPKVWTDALDSETFTKTALADRMVTIADTFKYENVLPGHTYELQGFLVDKNNTKRVDADKVVYVKDTTGGAVSNSKRFYSEGSAGTVELQFSFDATAYDADDWKGMVLVVYEYLYIVRDYLGDDSLALVGSHDDIDDPKQTIYIPYMATTLLHLSLHPSHSQAHSIFRNKLQLCLHLRHRLFFRLFRYHQFCQLANNSFSIGYKNTNPLPGVLSR